MAAVLRVKRSLEEEPISALIFSCKRRKTDSENDSPIETLFEFAGTVKDAEENITHISPGKLSKSDVKTRSRPSVNLPEKVRACSKASSQNNRYKLVNYFRTQGKPDPSSCGEGDAEVSVTVLDVEALHGEEHNVEDKNVPEKGSDESSGAAQYVYDLYRIKAETNDIDMDDLLLDGLVSFAPVGSELVFESYRNHKAGEKGSDSDSSAMDDEDDSNDENNWRNDYPDADDSDVEEGLARGFGRVTFGDGELSSDEFDESLVYTEDLSPTDVNLYGAAYARFKKRALKELNSKEECPSDSDEGSGDSSISNKSICSSDDNIDTKSE